MKSVLALILACAALPAQAFVAENNKPVQQTGPNQFTVAYAGDSVVREFWCAAGDFVMHGLALGPATRIWRVSGKRTGGQGIAFSLSPEGAQPAGIAILGGDGRSLTAGHAYQLCERRIRILDDLF